MKREIITTGDGSVTIYLPEMQESYHSRFGAITEAYHVFINHGLALTKGRPVSILEIGFGTGLNAFITYIEAAKSGQQVQYTGVELYPVAADEALKLNYAAELGAGDGQAVFNQMHSAAWETDVNISINFVLHKQQKHFDNVNDNNTYDLIYFDAFGYPFQPELWSEAIFKKMFQALKPNGILVTYACRSVIKNAMKAAGFTTEKLPGPPGKREMLRAIKG